MGRRGTQTTNQRSIDSIFGCGGYDGGSGSGDGDGGRNVLLDAMNGRWGGIRV